MDKKILISGSVLAGLAVAIGAFGAHALQDILVATQRMETFETATKYHLFHALALLVVGILESQNAHKSLRFVSILFLSGTLVFSGSLYILSITNILWLGAITPIGGVLFILGWVLLVAYLWRSY
ncbi:MAG: DUF423 domain-containing protein [Marinoscillum sp.]